MRLLTIYLTCCLWLGAMSAYGKIVFHSHRDGKTEIYLMHSDGEGQTRLTHNQAGDDFFSAWSPNGRQIVFCSERDGNPEIYVMDADGGNQRNLTQHPAFESSPDWSPDGSQIAFTSNRDSGDAHDLNIFVMDADGSNVRQVTQLAFAVAPKWSPDGERIAFEGIIDQRRQIYVINADGTNRQLVSRPIPDAGIFLGGWSPDGAQILYKGSINDSVKNSTVIITTLKTKKHEPVPIPKMDLTSVDWGANGKSILFAGRKEGGNWDIYRFRLRDRQLIQLTDHPAKDSSPHEWNPSLSVSPQGLAPKRWGEIKSNSYPHRGNGRGATPPIP